MSNPIQDFVNKMLPYAKKASAATDIPVEVVLGQWGEESNWGQSDLAKRANNYAGIKANSTVKDGVSGAYASYSSLNSWVRGWVHTMNLSYYKAVRDAGGVSDTVHALDASPWASDPKYYTKVMGAVNAVKPYVGDTSSSGFNIDGLVGKFEGLSDTSKKMVYAIGGLLVVMGLLK